MLLCYDVDGVFVCLNGLDGMPALISCDSPLHLSCHILARHVHPQINNDTQSLKSDGARTLMSEKEHRIIETH